MIDFTTIVGVDEQHLPELRLVFPTWQRHRPEMLRQPLLLVVDSVIAQRRGLFDFVYQANKRTSILSVPLSGEPQRERMLRALTVLAPLYVETPWLLKVDTDAPAKSSDPGWCSQALVAPAADGRECAFCASPWGYTKPAIWIRKLEVWASKVPELRGGDPLPLATQLAANKDQGSVTTPGRIISYVFFGRTDWLRWAAGLPGAPAVPSQDTYHWYVAQRHRDFFRTVRMKKFGWDHARARHLPRICAQALQESTP